jgi:ferrous-iron efflux pump FieF
MQHDKLIKLTSRASVAVATSLVIVKFIAWQQSNLISISASLFDSLSDLLSSIVNFCTIMYAIKPADDDHRFGHGKAEALAGMLQSLLILISTLYVFTYSLFFSQKNVDHGLENHNKFIIFTVLLSLVLTLFLLILQKNTIKKTRSLVIEADYLHYKNDMLVNLAVLLAIFCTNYIWWFDVLIGGGIFFYVILGAFEITKKSFEILMDKELSDDTRRQILEIVNLNSKVIGVHELRTRSNGRNDFIQMHLDLDENLSLKEAHSIAEEVEQSILSKFKNAEVLIHQDPYVENPVKKTR